MTGALADSGKFTTVESPSTGLDQTLTGKKGTLVLHLEFVTLSEPRVTVTWTVTSGSGEYEGVEGEGEGEHLFAEGEKFDGTYTGSVND